MVSWSQARAASALFKSASSRHFEINWSIEVMEGMLKEFQDSSGKPLVLGAWFPGSGFGVLRSVRADAPSEL